MFTLLVSAFPLRPAACLKNIRRLDPNHTGMGNGPGRTYVRLRFCRDFKRGRSKYGQSEELCDRLYGLIALYS